MGAANVAAVFTRWGGHDRLPSPAFRLLAYMALVAKDMDDPPKFFGGRELLLLGLGRDGDEAGLRAVRRALTSLLEAGAISRDRHSAPGQTARYALHLTADASRPLNIGRVTTPEQGTPRDRNRGRTVT